MERRLKKIAFLLCAAQGLLHADIGCMDNSDHAWHCTRYNEIDGCDGVCDLTEFDTKALYYVGSSNGYCTCECWRYTPNARGQCPECQHYRMHPSTELEIPRHVRIETIQEEMLNAFMERRPVSLATILEKERQYGIGR